MNNGIAGGIHGRNNNAYGDVGASSFRNEDVTKKPLEQDENMKAHQTPGFHVPGDGRSIMQ